jgi:pimeloyl-ACP methyl ester carboxylesterase
MVLPSSPAEFISALERASERRITPNGDGGEIVWRLWGRGEPLVLLHGGTGSWLHWVRNIEPLARDFRLIVPDIPGSGESASPEPPISAERIAAALSRGLGDIIGHEQSFALAGFSMGGLISGYMVAQCGERVRLLVLVGATATGAPRAPMEPLTSWRRLPTEAEKLGAHRKNLGILMIREPERIDALAVTIQSRNAELSRIRGKHVSHTGSLEQCLPGMRGRLAGIWGEHDVTAVPYLSERRAKLAEFRPGSTFDIFPGVGHWVQYEAHEDFNRRVAELMRSGG